MKATKTCEKCGEPYEIEPGLEFISRYCETCRRIVAGMRRKGTC